MCKELDYSEYDDVLEKFRKDPERELLNATINDFRLVTRGAANDLYTRMMEKLDGQEDLKDMLHMYSHLVFTHYEYELENIVLSDIDVAKKEICKIWPEFALH